MFPQFWQQARSILVRRQNAVWTGNFAAVALRVVQNVAIARFAGPDQMGVYVAVAAYALIVSRILDVGLPNALVYFVRASIAGRRRCIFVCLAHGLFVFLASLGVFLLVPDIDLATDVVSNGIRASVLILSLLVMVQFLNAVLGQMLIPIDAYRSYAVVTLTSPIIMIATLLTFSDQVNVATLVFCLFCGESAAACLALVSLRRFLRYVQHDDGPPSLLSIYSYALRTYVGTVVKVFGQRADRIILSWFVSPSSLAAYALATGLRDSAQLPVTTHAALLRNKLIDEEQRPGGSKSATRHLRRDVGRWLVISTIITIALVIACPILVPLLYGAGFADAVRLFVIIALGIPALAVSNLCWTGLLSSKRPGLVSMGLFLNGALGLAAIYLGGRFGTIETAAWASLGVSVIMAQVWAAISLRETVAANLRTPTRDVAPVPTDYSQS